MRICEFVGCEGYPCRDVLHSSHRVPQIEVDPATVSLVLISEAAPPDPADDYYAEGKPLFQQTTVLAFQEAGIAVNSTHDLLAHGVYLTTAIKCAKTAYAIQPATVKNCSLLLERELAAFPQARVWLLMGDVAIRAVNKIARRSGAGRAIPGGATYKIRGNEFTFRGIQLLPSYLQAGPAFFIENSKRRMIAEDIATAMRLI